MKPQKLTAYQVAETWSRIGIHAGLMESASKRQDFKNLILQQREVEELTEVLQAHYTALTLEKGEKASK